MFKLSQVYPHLEDITALMMVDERENNEERSARSRVGLISHYPDRWCIIPILCRVTGSAAVRSWPLLCPGKNSNLPGVGMRKKKKGGEEEVEKDGEKKRWRGEVAWRGGGKRRKRHEEVGEALV